MKKEITGWVYLDEDKNFTTMNFHQRMPDNFNEMKNVAKAKIIIDMPEKKIEITESGFDKSFEAACEVTNQKYISHFYRELKLKLFGRDGES